MGTMVHRLLFMAILIWNENHVAFSQDLAIFNYIPTLTAKNISQQCIDDSRYYAMSLSNFTDWALFMHESSGKLPEEIHILMRTQSGQNRFEYGSFDQCISAESDNDRFTGQYCTVFLELEPFHSIGEAEEQGEIRNTTSRVPKSKDIKIPKLSADELTVKESIVGLCLPSSCSAQDVRSAVAQRIGNFNFTLGGSIFASLSSYRIKDPNTVVAVTTIADEKYCFTREKVKKQSRLDASGIAMMAVLGCLFALVVLTTLQEVREDNRFLMLEYPETQSSQQPIFFRLLRSFSAITNWKKLWKKGSPNNKEIPCVNGIRVLTISYMLLIHFAEALHSRFIYNRNMAIEEVATKWYVHLIGNASVLVDTFFFLSGLLVTWKVLGALDKTKGRFNALLFYAHRYMRLTPAYALILGFVATLWERMGSGPDWAYVQESAKACREKWWTHLLYINNYEVFNPNLNCMIESWYMASDMQMYWLSPLIIYPLWRWKRVGMAWAITNLVGFIGLNIAVYIAWQLPPTIMTFRPIVFITVFDFFSDYLMRTYFRCSPYIIGIIIGYLLHKTKQSKIKLKHWIAAMGWILTAVTFLLVIFGLMPVSKEDNVPINSVLSVVYGSLHRSAWAAAIGWIVFACFHGYGGFVNRILSWEFFTPLSRLSYIVYLTHYTYIKTVFALYRKPLYYTFILSIVFYVGILVVTFLFSSLIAIVVEIPFLNLLNFTTASSPRKKQNEDKEDTVEMKVTDEKILDINWAELEIKDAGEETPCVRQLT